MCIDELDVDGDETFQGCGEMLKHAYQLPAILGKMCYYFRSASLR